MIEFLAVVYLLIMAVVALACLGSIVVHAVAVLIVWTGRPKWLCERMEGTSDV